MDYNNEISFIIVAENFIFSTYLRYVDNIDFVFFLEDYNRYKFETFSVSLIIKGLSNDKSHFVVA